MTLSGENVDEVRNKTASAGLPGTTQMEQDRPERRKEPKQSDNTEAERLRAGDL